jgi:hypothetical protein
LQNPLIEGNSAMSGICGYLLNCNYSKGDEKWIQIALQADVRNKEHGRAGYEFLDGIKSGFSS